MPLYKNFQNTSGGLLLSRKLLVLFLVGTSSVFIVDKRFLQIYCEHEKLLLGKKLTIVTLEAVLFRERSVNTYFTTNDRLLSLSTSSYKSFSVSFQLYN